MKRKAPTATPPPELPVTPKREVIGRCGYCLLEISAMQPGGLDGRHVDGTPYGECPQARRARANGWRIEV